MRKETRSRGRREVQGAAQEVKEEAFERYGGGGKGEGEIDDFISLERFRDSVRGDLLKTCSIRSRVVNLTIVQLSSLRSNASTLDPSRIDFSRPATPPAPLSTFLPTAFPRTHKLTRTPSYILSYQKLWNSMMGRASASSKDDGIGDYERCGKQNGEERGSKGVFALLLHVAIVS